MGTWTALEPAPPRLSHRRRWLFASALPVRRHAIPVLAVLLAFLVFVPGVSIVGSWANPAAVGALGNGSEHSAIAPAQLVAPAARPVPVFPQILLLIALAASLYYQWLSLAASGAYLREPIPPPGRRGRALLHAYLN